MAGNNSSPAPYNFLGQDQQQIIQGSLHIESSGNSDGTLTVDGNSVVSGNGTTTGTSTLTGNTTVGGTLVVAGALTTNGGLITNGINNDTSSSPGLNGYLAWNFPVWLASTAITLTTTDIYMARFIAPTSQTVTNLDVYCTNMNSGTVTLAEAGLYPSAGGSALSTTADIHLAWTTTGVQTFTLTTPQLLSAGSTYVVMIITTATTSGPSIAAGPTVAALNVNLAAHVGNTGTYGTGAAIPTTYTITSGTATTTTPFWFGLR